MQWTSVYLHSWIVYPHSLWFFWMGFICLKPFSPRSPSLSACVVALVGEKVVGLLEAWVGDRAALQATTDLHTLRAAVKVGTEIQSFVYFLLSG